MEKLLEDHNYKEHKKRDLNTKKKASNTICLLNSISSALNLPLDPSYIALKTVSAESIKWSNLGFWCMTKSLKLYIIWFDLCVKFIGVDNSIGETLVGYVSQILSNKALIGQVNQILCSDSWTCSCPKLTSLELLFESSKTCTVKFLLLYTWQIN